MDQILSKRIIENVLVLDIPGSSHAFLEEISEFVETFLESNEVFRALRFGVSWVLRELLDNALRHGECGEGHSVLVRVGHTATGLQVAVDQPDTAPFSINEAIAHPDNQDSFLQIMHRAGVRLRDRREGGRLHISAEIPKGLSLGPLDTLAAPISESFSQTFRPSIPKVDETYASAFGEELFAAVQDCHPDTATLVLDLAEVKYMSSRGLRALTLAQRAATARGIDIVVTNLGEVMREIFAISRYDKVFRVIGG
jgi:anti-anti-sigma factor